MRIEIKCHDCPAYKDEVSDCAKCLARYLQGGKGVKPNCFAIKDDGSSDLVVWIKSGDQFTSVPENQPHLISSTDWLS